MVDLNTIIRLSYLSINNIFYKTCLTSKQSKILIFKCKTTPSTHILQLIYIYIYINICRTFYIKSQSYLGRIKECYEKVSFDIIQL